MKKTLLVLICMIMAISIFAIPICAAESGYFSAPSSNIKVGDTFDVTVNIKGGENIGTIGIIPSFDDRAFEFVRGKWLVSGALEEADITKGGAALIAFSGTESINGPVYSFTLRVKEAAQYGTYTISGTVNTGKTISMSAATVSIGNTNDSGSEDDNGNNGGNGNGNGNISGNEHSFTDKNTSEKYKKKDATCTSPAVYYYSCKCCGEASATATFEYGELGDHNFNKRVTASEYLASSATCEKAAEYYLTCECGQKGRNTFTYGSPAGHSGGTATCTKAAVCDVCRREYGSRGAHSYTEKVARSQFLAKKANCTQEETYYMSCKCGEVGHETFTYGQPLEHQYDSKWEYDGSRHYKKCTRCGSIGDNEQHVPGPEASENSAQTCIVCGYVIAPPLDHTHDYSIDSWDSDASGHWTTCSCGQILNSDNHLWDDGRVLVEATSKEYGQIEYVCQVCSHSKLEYTSKLTEEPEWTTDNPLDTPEKETTTSQTDEAANEIEPQPGEEIFKETSEIPPDEPIGDTIGADLTDTDEKVDPPSKVALAIIIIVVVGVLGTVIILFTAKRKS